MDFFFFSDLEETLLLLPYSAACEILQMLPRLLKSNFHTELLTRLTICLIQAHHGPIMSNQNLLLTLETIKPLIFNRISTLRVIIYSCIIVKILNNVKYRDNIFLGYRWI